MTTTLLPPFSPSGAEYALPGLEHIVVIVVTDGTPDEPPTIVVALLQSLGHHPATNQALCCLTSNIGQTHYMLL